MVVAKTTTQQTLAARGVLQTALAMGGQLTNDGIKVPFKDLSGAVGYRVKRVNASKGSKFYWLDKRTQPNYHYHDDLIAAVAAAGGVVYIANGDTSVWSYVAAGYKNAFCWKNGETSIPKDILAFLNKIGATEVRYPADKDATGRKSAKKLRDSLSSTQIVYKALEWGAEVPEKGDANDLWQAVKFDPSAFKTVLENLPALVLPKDDPQPRRTSNYGYTHIGADYERALDEAKERVGVALGVSGYKSNGWSRKNVICPFRDEQHASASYNRQSGILNDFGGETYYLRELCEYFNIPYPQRPRRQKSTRQPTVDLDAAPVDNIGEGDEIGDKIGDEIGDKNGDEIDAFAARVRKANHPRPSDLSADQQVNMRWISELPDIEALMQQHQALLIKSPIGTGKTALVKERIYPAAKALMGGEDAHLRVLYLVHRRTLARNITDRLCEGRYDVFECYLSIDHAGDLKAITRLVNSFDSLKKVIGTDLKLPRYDLIVIDEIEQFLTHLDAQTFEDKPQSYAVLLNLMGRARWVIGLDAHASDVSKDFLRRHVGSAYAIENTHVVGRGEMTLHERKESVYHKAASMLESEGKIAFACGSKSESIAAHAYFSEQFPDKRILLVNSDNSNGADIQKLLDRAQIDQTVNDHDMLIYSPSLGTGFDIQTPVDLVAGVFTGGHLSADDIHQMLGRCRNRKDTHVYIQEMDGRAETDPQVLYQMVLRRDAITAQIVSFDRDGNPELHHTLRDMAQTWAACIARQNASKNNLMTHFIGLAAGFTIQTQSSPKDKALLDKLADEKTAISEAEIQAMLDDTVRPIDHDTYRALVDNPLLTSEERRRAAIGRQKGILIDTYGELNEEIVLAFIDPVNRYKQRRFTDLYAPDDNLEQVDQLEQHSAYQDRNHHSATRRFTRSFICAVFEGDLKKEIDKDVFVERVRAWWAMYGANAETLLMTRHGHKCRARNEIGQARWLLERLGLSLKRNRRRAGGGHITYGVDQEVLAERQHYAKLELAQREKRVTLRQDGNKHLPPQHDTV